MTLTEFLLARISEDERDARNAEGRYDFERDAPNNFDVFSLLHLMKRTPRRTVAEGEARRRMIADLTPYCWRPQRQPCGTCDRIGCRNLRLLALPYADHPDFDEAWRV
jgi:hypothetical protein